VIVRSLSAREQEEVFLERKCGGMKDRHSSAEREAGMIDATAFDGCINLRRSFGQRYKIGFDEAAVTWGERADPWMQTLLCQKGVIYPQGGEILAVEIDGRPITAKLVAAISGVTLWQDGDHEKTFLLPVDLFDQVAEVVKPRKRRRLSEEQKTRCVERLAKYRPKPPRQSAGEELGPLATA
jgi:hypothetical protein